MEDISQDHIQMANKHGKLVKSFFIHKMQNKMLLTNTNITESNNYKKIKFTY